MCNRWVWIFSGILLILFRNSVLLLVCLKWFCWMVFVLVKVFFLWLNSLDLIKFFGMVVILSVINGVLVCGLWWCSVWVISFLLVFDLLLISMLIEECDSWLIMWNIFCMVGVLFIMFVVGLLILILCGCCCFW